MTQKTISHELAKECIFTALMLLMEKQDYEKITITDIARRAGVSRMTYYRVVSHLFPDKRELFFVKLQTLLFCWGISPHCPGMAGNRHAGRRGNDGPPVLQYHRKNTPGSEYVIFVTNRPDL